MKVTLISTYEIGRQPFGIASPARWLREQEFEVEVLDLSIDAIDPEKIAEASLVCFYVPMHTATKLAIEALPKIQQVNPAAKICFYGLYAPMNAGYLRSLGADFILGGEFEEDLVNIALRLRENLDSDDISTISLNRLPFKTPLRDGLPELSKYAHLMHDDGTLDKIVGYTETTRGCKHTCRHCPIVPIYGGKFRLVQKDVVLADVRQQVKAGAEHITFGDPDFLNGPGHVIPIVEELHRAFPDLTYDVTIKVEHLLQHAELLPTLKNTRCALITSAVESLDDQVLEILDKGHSRADFIHAVDLTRENRLNLNPTFVTFTPWTTLDDYRELLQTIHNLELIPNVSPVQLAIRLLIPEGSKLLDVPETHHFIAEFDEQELVYPWTHPDYRMEILHNRVREIVQEGTAQQMDRFTLFQQVWDALNDISGETLELHNTRKHQKRSSIPYLNEPWYC